MQAFQPLTISDLAKLLDVCERTIRNHVDQGAFPAPVTICGKKYWHPDVFYHWLDRTLKHEATAALSKPSQCEPDTLVKTTNRLHSPNTRSRARSEERRVGQESDRTCRSRWSRHH